jgi:hypothetical protein
MILLEKYGIIKETWKYSTMNEVPLIYAIEGGALHDSPETKAVTSTSWSIRI